MHRKGIPQLRLRQEGYRGNDIVSPEVSSAGLIELCINVVRQ